MLEAIAGSLLIAGAIILALVMCGVLIVVALFWTYRAIERRIHDRKHGTHLRQVRNGVRA